MRGAILPLPQYASIAWFLSTGTTSELRTPGLEWPIIIGPQLNVLEGLERQALWSLLMSALTRQFLLSHMECSLLNSRAEQLAV